MSDDLRKRIEIRLERLSKQMSPLVLTSEETFKRLKAEIGMFLDSLDKPRK